jgi:iron complex outermembrane recepter protein
MRTSPFLFLIIFIFASQLFSQTRFEGYIYDNISQKPLVGANITMGDRGTMSDKEGYFSFVSESTGPLIIQYIGYKTQSISSFTHGMKIYLEPILIRTQSIVVKGGYVNETLTNQNASIAIFDTQELKKSKAQHFQGLMNQIPNLNFAGGTSRPRYFQIRGIGERSQFAGEGSPVFSVGFLFDDFDMTGMSMNSFLFDIDQVEVFRGPQSSVFGPSAIGGLIYMRSKDIPKDLEVNFKFSAGNYRLLEKAFSIGTSHFNNLYAHRLMVLSSRHNGFRENKYLNRDDTNGKNEFMMYYKGKIQSTSNIITNFAVLKSMAKNGYDAWSPDNKRVSYADQPGVDHQDLDGFSANTIWTPSGDHLLKISYAQTQSKMVYSYDSDWGNNIYWAQEPYNFDPVVEGWEYSFFDETFRDRFTQSMDLKWNYLPKNKDYNLTAGFYIKNLTESDSATGWLFGGDDFSLLSEYNIGSISSYIQYQNQWTSKFSSLFNIRGEMRNTDYNDDNDVNSVTIDSLLGWKASFDYQLTDHAKIFFSAARGYKGGGINQHPKLSDENRPYSSETMDNFEIGLRSIGENYQIASTAFYAIRHHQQVNLSRQQNENDPNSFVYFTSNATSGNQSGLEIEGEYVPHKKWTIKTAIGFLKTHVDAYEFKVDSLTTLQLGDREIAQAPRYSFQVSAEFRLSKSLQISISANGKDAFYYSDSHDEISQAFTLMNADISYQFKDFTTSLWVKNLMDVEYGVRGFYFGVEPPNYEDKLYIGLGDARQMGITFEYSPDMRAYFKKN